ncbi:hypothetical protein [Streptomyces sp. NPDC093225]|uniref:hypothetical protein n=1 Tax=Streptomyces sp. NPDC093225 TaxID=3366034 RepID=UPI0038291641
MAGLALLNMMNGRAWPPAQQALDTLLLYQLAEFQGLDRFCPAASGTFSPPRGWCRPRAPHVRDLLQDLISRNGPAADPEVELRLGEGDVRPDS